MSSTKLLKQNFENLLTVYYIVVIKLWLRGERSWGTEIMSGTTDNGVAGTHNVQPTITECKLYKRRWLMLVLFVLCSMINAVQWIQYSIISNVVIRFYNVSSFAVDFTSIVYMITYIPLIFPASWILEKKVNIIHRYLYFKHNWQYDQ